MKKSIWTLNCQKLDYDFNHNLEYKSCPFCDSNLHKGSKRQDFFEKYYQCGSKISAKVSNYTYNIDFNKVICSKENIYNNKNVSGRVLAPMTYKNV